MNLILNIAAAIQIGKDAYPPIPKIILGRLYDKNINDLNIEYKINDKENINKTTFFFINGDEGKTKTFFLSVSLKNLYPLLSVTILTL